MSTANTGAAREVAPGRLANFEDSDDADMSPAISLPPRRRTTTREEPPRREAPKATPPRSEPVETPQRPTEAPKSSPEQPSDTTGAAKAPAAPQKAPKGPEDKVRPSNVHIPVVLLGPLEAKCKAEGLSHGEIIIVAIENAYPRLKDLIHPVATAGGSLFASRRSRASRAADGPLTPLNYRLREADFTTLDQLVEEFGASSRGHLITAALNDYFHDQI